MVLRVRKVLYGNCPLREFAKKCVVGKLQGLNSGRESGRNVWFVEE
jgi:hypothetical protein